MTKTIMIMIMTIKINMSKSNGMTKMTMITEIKILIKVSTKKND